VDEGILRADTQWRSSHSHNAPGRVVSGTLVDEAPHTTTLWRFRPELQQQATKRFRLFGGDRMTKDNSFSASWAKCGVFRNAVADISNLRAVLRVCLRKNDGVQGYTLEGVTEIHAGLRRQYAAVERKHHTLERKTAKTAMARASM
jgi:hypothetical protein